MTDVLMDLGAGPLRAATGQAAGFLPPRFRARLGPARGLRFVQAPDWWKNEPVFLVDHSKVTRRDAALSLATAGGSEASVAHLSDVLVKAHWTGTSASPFGETTRHVPVRDAAGAAVRQMAHEVLASPELLKLAGRGGKGAGG